MDENRQIFPVGDDEVRREDDEISPMYYFSAPRTPRISGNLVTNNGMLGDQKYVIVHFTVF